MDSYDDFYSSALKEVGGDRNKAHDFAMANIMGENGIKLLKKGSDGEFKQMDVKKTTDPTTGKTTYTLTICKLK